MSLLTTDSRKASRFNWTLLILVVLLLSVGLLNLWSALSFWEDTNNLSLFWSQTVWISIGLVAMLIMAFFDYRLIEKASAPIYVMSILLLLVTVFFGKMVSGHRSWLSLGGLVIQPSEFAKLALIIMLSGYFSKRPNPEGIGLFEMWRPALYTALPVILVLLQKDLGSAIFYVLVFCTYAWFGRLKGKGVATLVSIALISSIVLYFFALADYQKARITSFMDPSRNAKGSGYHLAQSRIAVGSGGLFGRGYMKGNINKLRYLPAKHTDFIFPVLAEEWGFAGSIFVITLYFLLLAVGVGVARRARDRAGLFLAIGIVALLFWHIIINLGGVLGLMPLTGISLPFLSYGGSSTIVLLSSIGVLFSIDMRRFLF